MRFKILTASPLPDLKAWFTIDSRNVPSTVLNLKNILCSQLGALRDANFTAGDIILLLDEFELLDNSPIDVVRDGDLICVKRSSASTSNKRKASSAEVDSPRKRPKHTSNRISKPESRPSPILSSSDSSSSDSSSSSSDTTDSSSDNSTSSSESDSDSETSTSSASSAPRKTSTRPLRTARNAPPTTKSQRGAQAQIHVPPGQGKSTTHSRNLRRRRKRQFDCNSLSQSVAPAGSSTANAVPLGLRAHGHTPNGNEDERDDEQEQEQGPLPISASDPSTVMMSSLRTKNKNKKRSLKNAMSTPLPQKIIFATPSALPSASPSGIIQSPPVALFAPVTTTASSPPKTLPRIIPPSERQAAGTLPANMFVTSVDVEEGKHKKKKKKQVKYDGGDGEVDESWYHDEYEDVREVKSSWIDYSAPNTDGDAIEVEQELAPPTYPAATTEDNDQIYLLAEARWDSSAPVINAAQLRAGQIVGWKALAINPTTFTPEVLLTLARVTALTSTSGTEDKVTVQVLPRPGAGNTSFSFGGVVDDVTDEQEQEQEETYSWGDAVATGWRSIDIN